MIFINIFQSSLTLAAIFASSTTFAFCVRVFSKIFTTSKVTGFTMFLSTLTYKNHQMSINSLRDCRQTFVTLNRFCILIPSPHSPPSPPVLNGQYQDGENTKQNQKKNTYPFYTVFQALKVLLIKICKLKPLDLLYLVVFISFYISRYHFSQIFKTSFSNKRFSSQIFLF